MQPKDRSKDGKQQLLFQTRLEDIVSNKQPLYKLTKEIDWAVVCWSSMSARAADLEKNKPRYIIYSLNTWRHDGINEDQQVPEVVSCIRQSYR